MSAAQSKQSPTVVAIGIGACLFAATATAVGGWLPTARGSERASEPASLDRPHLAPAPVLLSRMPVGPVSVEDFLAEYRQGAAAADLKYLGKRVIVDIRLVTGLGTVKGNKHYVGYQVLRDGYHGAVWCLFEPDEVNNFWVRPLDQKPPLRVVGTARGKWAVSSLRSGIPDNCVVSLTECKVLSGPVVDPCCARPSN